MTDNRTTELLQELRDLACDINASEIIDHVHITHRGWTFESQWLDSWHAEFDRITDKLDQAIAATLGSETCAFAKPTDLTDGCAVLERIAELEELVQDWQAIADALLRCLENDWHIRASWDGLRKFWRIELTEDGVRLRDAERHGEVD